MDKDLFDPVKVNAGRRSVQLMDDTSKFIYDCRVQYAMTGDEVHLKRMIRESVPLFTRGGICATVSLARRNSGCSARAITGG